MKAKIVHVEPPGRGESAETSTLMPAGNQTAIVPGGQVEAKRVAADDGFLKPQVQPQQGQLPMAMAAIARGPPIATVMTAPGPSMSFTAAMPSSGGPSTFASSGFSAPAPATMLPSHVSPFRIPGNPGQSASPTTFSAPNAVPLAIECMVEAGVPVAPTPVVEERTVRDPGTGAEAVVRRSVVSVPTGTGGVATVVDVETMPLGARGVGVGPVPVEPGSAGPCVMPAPVLVGGMNPGVLPAGIAAAMPRDEGPSPMDVDQKGSKKVEEGDDTPKKVDAAAIKKPSPIASKDAKDAKPVTDAHAGESGGGQRRLSAGKSASGLSVEQQDERVGT
ncbi:hypothetical protein HDU96_002862, partial [Phlyctochytrium bullatum]